jgi:cytoskeleton-associated protein 5
LYEFQKQYPHTEAKVNTYLSQTGNYFQSYIRRGLSNLAAEDNELHAAAAAAAAVTTPTALGPSMLSTPSQSMDYQSSSFPISTAVHHAPTAPILEQHHHQQQQPEQRLSSFETHQQSRNEARSSIHAGGK